MSSSPKTDKNKVEPSLVLKFQFLGNTLNQALSQVLSNTTDYQPRLGRTLKVPIAKLGVWEHPVYKYVTFTQEDFNDIKQNFDDNEMGFEPYLRYGHARYPGAADGEPATAWLKQIQQEGEILYGLFEPNTSEIISEIQDGKYRYSSAELTRNAHSKVLGKGQIGTVLTAVSLTNAPFLPDLPENQVLSEHAEDFHFFVLNQKEITMTNTNTEDTGLLQGIKSGIEKVVQLLSNNPFAAVSHGPERNGSSDNKLVLPGNQELEELVIKLTQGESESDEHYSMRLSVAKQSAFEQYSKAGKSEQDFNSDMDQFCSMLSEMSLSTKSDSGTNGDDDNNNDNMTKDKLQKYSQIAQALTASPFTTSPVYENGKLVKGRANQDSNNLPKFDDPVATLKAWDPNDHNGDDKTVGDISPRKLSNSTTNGVPGANADPNLLSSSLANGVPAANADPELLSATLANGVPGANADPELLSASLANGVPAANADPELLSTMGAKQRKDLQGEQFAVPGKRKLPINDAAHVRNALARFNQTEGLTEAEKAEASRRIHAAAKRFGIQVSEANSANGGTTTNFRAMPDYQPGGPNAYLMQSLSQGAHNAGRAVDTHKEEIMPDVAELQAKVAEMEQKLSNQMTLQDELSQAKTQLAQLAQKAANAENEANEVRLSQMAEKLKSEGIPPVLVDDVVKLVHETGHEQKLSVGGAEYSLADTLFNLLNKLPAEHRVNLRQVGAKQSLSNHAQGDTEPFAFEGVMNERMGA